MRAGQTGRRVRDSERTGQLPGDMWRLHHRLSVSRADRLLDVACGSGLAMELATLRGASCAGIDASDRLVAIARDRNSDADVVVGDMNQLPWETPRSGRHQLQGYLGDDPRRRG